LHVRYNTFVMDSCGFGGVMMKWFLSNLTSRIQFVRTSVTSSLLLPVLYGVSQGQFYAQFSPTLLYVADILQLIQRHQLILRAFANDIQI